MQSNESGQRQDDKIHDTEQYGASTWLCDYIVAQQLRALAPREVVDFGAGAGKNGELVRQVLGRDCRLIAVEGFEKTAKMLRGGSIYDQVDHCLLQEWVDRNAAPHAVAIFGDVIEHLTPREIHYVVRRALTQFKHLIIVVPLYDIFQDDAYGNPLEIHKAYITGSFFDRYKPTEKHIIESPDFTMMNLLIHSERVTKPLHRRLAWQAFHLGMLTLQPIGLARPTVDVLKRTVGRYKRLIR